MMVLPLALAVLVQSFAATAQEPEAPAAHPPVFDGESLQGWSGDPRFWSVEDGAIVGRSTAEIPCERTTYLALEDVAVRDFELSFEFRIDGPGANSGLQFRSVRGGEFSVSGYQADMDAKGQWTGGIYEQDGRGVLVKPGTSVTITGAERRQEPLDEAPAAAAPGQWHSYLIRALGPRVELFVNGALTAQLVDSAERFGGDTLALQMHQGPPMEVRYRSFDLTPLGRDSHVADLDLAPGFAAERLLVVPARHGSWVSLCVDPKGQLIAASEADRSLFRVTLKKGSEPSIEPLWQGETGTGSAAPSVPILHGSGGGFSGPFQDAVFVGNGSRGTITWVALGERGETQARSTLLAAGRPFPVTDIAWLQDGSMAVLTGGGLGPSAIYRIWEKAPPADPTKGTAGKEPENKDQ